MSTTELIARQGSPADAATKFVMRLDDVPRQDGSRPRDGHYFLRSFDADAEDGQGKIELTGAIDRAMKFASPVEVYNLWRTTTLLQYAAEILTSDGRALICRRCVEYVALGGEKEVYEYDPPEGYRETGERIYIDVKKAREILKASPRPFNWEDKPENLLPHVLSHEIYEPHLPHVPTSRLKPGLLLRFHFTRLDNGSREEIHVFADGNHRLASDLAAGAPFCFHALTFEESKQCSSTNLFAVSGPTFLTSLIEVCRRRGMKPSEFLRQATDNLCGVVGQRAATTELDKERPTKTEINRLRALRDAAIELTRLWLDGDARFCLKPDEHKSIDCPHCGKKGLEA